MKSIALMLFVLISACGASARCRPERQPLLFMTEGTLVHVGDIAEARLACALTPDQRFFLYEVRPHGHQLVMACVGGQIVPVRVRIPGCFPNCY